MKKLTFAVVMGFAGTNILLSLSARAADTILDVPEGAVITNTTALLAETANVDKLVKRGKGTYYANCPLGRDASSWSQFAELLVEEGEIILCCGEYSSHGNCNLGKITVKSGARVRCEKQSGQNNAFSQFYRVYPSLITIEAGALFDANGGSVSSYLIYPCFAGAGTLLNSTSTHCDERFTGFTGTFLNDTAASQSNPTFGDSTAAFDFSRMKGVVVSNNYYRNEAVRMYFQNPGTQVIERFPVTTAFATNTGPNSLVMASAYFYNDTTINDFSSERIRPLLSSATTKLTLNGGRGTFIAPVNDQHIGLTAGSTFTINGGHFTGHGYEGGSSNPNHARNRYYTTDLYDGKTKVGVVTLTHVNFRYAKFDLTQNASAFIMNGGSIYLNQGNPKSTYLRGGKVVWNGLYNKSATCHSNVWDGAKCYGWTRGSAAFTLDIDRYDTPIVHCVGKKGGWFETLGRGGTSICLNRPWESACPADETDGGMKFFGYGTVCYKAQPIYRGPLEMNAAALAIPVSSNYTIDYDSANLYGYGNLVLGNTRLSDNVTGQSIRLAGGPGAKLVAKGAAQLSFKKADGDATKVSSYVIGPSGATTSSLAREKGGAFLLYPGNNSVFAIGTESSLKVEGGVEKNAAGLPKVPVLQTNAKNYSVSAMDLSFTDYDAETGFVPFANCQSAFGNRATDVVWLYNVQTNLTEDTVVGALKLENNNNFVSKVLTDTRANIYLSEGVTLTVGDGMNPATVLFNSTSADVQACVKGDGTLAFGSSEALFVVNGQGGLLNCNVTGNNDFSFVGTGYYPSMRLCRDQNWTGTVRANNCRLVPETDGALGTAKVVLGSGWGYGGTLDLSTPNLVIANDITMGGSGTQRDGESAMGAILVRTNATLTGAIDFYGTGWIGVADTAELTLAGEMTGDDNLEIANNKNNTFEVTKVEDKVYSVSETALARDTNGRVIVTGANDAYTGDVSVIRTTLVLRGAKAGLGWGDVELDAATLRFENTAPCRVRGRVTGSGILELAGHGLVTFDDLYGQASQPMPVATPETGYTINVATAKDESKFTLNLVRARTAVNSLKGVGEITTDLTRPVHLSVLDDEPGSYTGTLPANVTLHYGEIYRTGLSVVIR